ncbi:hypothetical protein DASB73_026010 [Starmerella bacillaris]|uniref:Uncharacterized protein n=1 Tax=Starmerella bacillaris TaxID=1247836 RepID=A0AAV5RKF5_STABA|nr:hypothetical protein DASB73_026010 [Starmerella bacillaris]
MQIINYLLSSFVSLLAFAEADNTLALTYKAHEIIFNDLPTNVNFTLSSPQDVTITEVRSVLHVPGKRTPKPYANFTHPASELTFYPEQGKQSKQQIETFFSFAPIYALPTKTFLMSYSVHLTRNITSESGEQISVSEWLDTEPTEVKFRDGTIGWPVTILASTIVGGSSTAFMYLFFTVAPPSFLAGIFPKALHRFIPALNEKPKSK